MSIFTRKKNTDPDAVERQRLREQIHGVEATCRACGIHGHVGTETIDLFVSVRGVATYGLCETCATREALGTLDRAAAADLLCLTVDDPALDGVKVTRFVDLAGHDPDRPNVEPFAHVDTHALAADVVERRRSIEDRTGGPCCCCGTTLAWPGAGFSTLTSGDIMCSTCFDVGSRWGFDREAIRNAAAAAALTGEDVTMVSRNSAGLGRTLGVKLYAEHGGPGAPEPWAHVDFDALRERARTDPAIRGDHPRVVELLDLDLDRPFDLIW